MKNISMSLRQLVIQAFMQTVLKPVRYTVSLDAHSVDKLKPVDIIATTSTLNNHRKGLFCHFLPRAVKHASKYTNDKI